VIRNGDIVMPNLSLRAYLQKIETSVEENNIDKAISQSLFLLQKFPKNLNAFQVLSKALLQKQDFINADKVFDIILQIEPEDFVSHIGKSIIAEFNHFLESAIEQMKFAFEIQPANEGLQNELKRLMLASDGVEPNKILLTRGALIKMYLKGKLYPQAISEARIGISESPQRIDYKIAMAKSFFESGDLIQAVETCVEVISHLPYCLPANLILDQILTKNHTTENFGFYHNRLIELDPYHAFMLSTTNSVLDVPDIAVLVEDYSGVENLAFDVNSILSTVNLNKSDDENFVNQPSPDTDWNAILDHALESVENDNKLKTNQNSNEILNSRKKTFLDKLRSPRTVQEDQKEIPDWFFDDNGDLNRSENEPNFQGTDELVDELALDNNGSMGFNSSEAGVFDSDITPAINSLDELQNTETFWLNDEEVTPQENHPKPETSLDDTQQIIITRQNPSDLLIDAAKALEGGNTKFAFSTLSGLLADRQNINELSIQLERAIELYPDHPEFRLLLSEVYLILGEKEKSLTILQNAQKNIIL